MALDVGNQTNSDKTKIPSRWSPKLLSLWKGTCTDIGRARVGAQVSPGCGVRLLMQDQEYQGTAQSTARGLLDVSVLPSDAKCLFNCQVGSREVSKTWCTFPSREPTATAS